MNSMKLPVSLFATFLAGIPFLSAQVATEFSHSTFTTAPPDQIWMIWTDVPNWHTWDTGLKSATLEGPFALEVKGKLIPDKGPKAKFVIAALEEGKSYTFKTKIPFGWLIVARELEIEAGKTKFTHTVSFTGLLKKTFAKRLGERYQKMLPEVMENIRRIAEQNQ